METEHLIVLWEKEKMLASIVISIFSSSYIVFYAISDKLQHLTLSSIYTYFILLPDDKILDRSTLKQSADDNFRVL